MSSAGPSVPVTARAVVVTASVTAVWQFVPGGR